MRISDGDVLGSWTLVRKLGAGGMGEVYVGENADGARCALKVGNRDAADPEGKRFLREIHTLATLSHPAIVRVLDYGTDPLHGVTWLAMALVPGETLGDCIERGPLDPARVRTIFRGLAEGLAYAHARGVYHRDVKPSNVMVNGDQAVLVDFGIAQNDDVTRMTRTGVFMGTPAYMAPEVFADGGVEAAAADIYALGQVMYEALTGREGFPADRTLSEPQRFAKIYGAKARTGHLDPGPQTDPALRDVTCAATAAVPDARLPSMKAFVDGLDRKVDGTTWVARPAAPPAVAAVGPEAPVASSLAAPVIGPTARPASRWRRRLRAAGLAGLTGVIVAVSGTLLLIVAFAVAIVVTADPASPLRVALFGAPAVEAPGIVASPPPVAPLPTIVAPPVPAAPVSASPAAVPVAPVSPSPVSAPPAPAAPETPRATPPPRRSDSAVARTNAPAAPEAPKISYDPARSVVLLSTGLLGVVSSGDASNASGLVTQAVGACYVARLADKPALAGKLAVDLRAGKSGVVEGVTLKGDLASDAPLRACVDKSGLRGKSTGVRGMTATTLSYSLKLSPVRR